MRYKKLGNSSLDLSVIGLGTWAIGGEGWDYAWGAQDDKQSVEGLIKGFEQGINWVDTAHVYGNGHSETVVGQALKEYKDDIIVATKCGLLVDENGHVNACLKKESIKDEVKGSLKRLGVDVIDIYQIHWPNPKNDIEEAFEALQELKKDGHIKYASVSNFSVKQMKQIESIAPIISLQPPFSMLNRHVEKEILPYCLQKNIGCVVYSPIQCGLLTDKASKDWVNSLSETDWRKTKSSYFQEPCLTETLQLNQKLSELAQEKGATLSQLAISWVLSFDAVTSAIVGVRKPEQILETVKAADLILNDEDLKNIDNELKGYEDRIYQLKK